MRNPAYRNPADYEPEPVFPLRRPPMARPYYPAERYSSDGRSSAPPGPSSLPRAWPFESEPELESGIYEIEDDEPTIRRPSRVRSIAVRFLGALVIGAAFYLCGAVLTNPQAGKAVLAWVTMGHANEVIHVVERAGSAIRALIGG